MVIQIKDEIYFNVDETAIRYNKWKIDPGIYILSALVWDDSISCIFSTLDRKKHYYSTPEKLSPLIITDRSKIESIKNGNNK